MKTTDPARDQLVDAATVHAVRAEVRPTVDEVVADLQTDPLGGPETLTRLERLTSALGSARVTAGREARMRLTLSLTEPRTRSL